MFGFKSLGQLVTPRMCCGRMTWSRSCAGEILTFLTPAGKENVPADFPPLLFLLAFLVGVGSYEWSY